MALEDVAQEHEAHLWTLANTYRGPRTPALRGPDDPAYGAANCETCDDDMPPQRRAYGYVLCTACQSAVERRRSGR